MNNKEKLKREKILNYDKIKLNKKVKICIVPRYKKVKKKKKELLICISHILPPILSTYNAATNGGRYKPKTTT